MDLSYFESIKYIYSKFIITFWPFQVFVRKFRPKLFRKIEPRSCETCQPSLTSCSSLSGQVGLQSIAYALSTWGIGSLNYMWTEVYVG
jgi:hypothetical protein